MAVFRYPNSKVWWYDFRFAGRRYRASTKTTSVTVAKAAEATRKSELIQGINRIPKQSGPILFSLASDQWLDVKKLTWAPKTLRGEKLHLAKLKQAFGNRLVSDFHPEDFKNYQLARQGRGAANKTINLEVATWRSVLLWHGVWSPLRPHVRMLPVLTDIGHALTEAEVETLLRECRRSRARYLETFVVVALSTCMRLSEIRLLQWMQVDLELAVIRVGQSKTAHSSNRRIPLNKTALSQLRSWASKFPNRQPEHFVFPHEKYGTPGSKTAIYDLDPTKAIVNIHTAWRYLKKRAHAKYRFHDLRHTGCTRMLEGDMSFPTVAAIMGWSPTTTIAMAKRYGHIEKRLKDAVAFLEGPKKTRRARKKTRRSTARKGLRRAA